MRELNSTLTSDIEKKPTSHIYFEKCFQINLSNRTKYICYHAKLETTHICNIK